MLNFFLFVDFIIIFNIGKNILTTSCLPFVLNQGMNIVLTGDLHCIGRLVDNYSFRINDIAVSGNHCRIFRGNVAVHEEELADTPVPSFLKDTRCRERGFFLHVRCLIEFRAKFVFYY